MSVSPDNLEGRKAIKSLFRATPNNVIHESVIVGLSNPEFWSFSNEDFRDSLSEISSHFDMSRVGKALADSGIVDIEGTVIIFHLLNSPLHYAAHLGTRSDEFKNHIYNLSGGLRKETDNLAESIIMEAMGIAKANGLFEGIMLSTASFGLVLGSDALRNMRIEIPVDEENKIGYRNQQRIIASVLDTLDSLGMQQSAATPEAVYERVVQFFTRNGIIAGLLADDKAAFGYDSADENSGCPGAGYALKALEAYGDLLRTDEGKVMFLNFISR